LSPVIFNTTLVHTVINRNWNQNGGSKTGLLMPNVNTCHTIIIYQDNTDNYAILT